MERKLLTVASALVGAKSDKPLSAGAHALVLRLADEVDRRWFKSEVADAIWVEFATAELRPGGRSDNVSLREWLRRLTGVQLSGERDGQPWGAVLVAEWQFIRGGTRVRVLVPPGAVNVLRAPATFGKVETDCVYRLGGSARRLYVALADKKNLRQSSWRFELAELRSILGVDGKKAYLRWDDFVRRVLTPALKSINDLGTVRVEYSPERVGRAIEFVRFEWRWKTPSEILETSAEADRHSAARGRQAPAEADAPPLSDDRRGSPEERARVAALASEFLARPRGEVDPLAGDPK